MVVTPRSGRGNPGSSPGPAALRLASLAQGKHILTLSESKGAEPAEAQKKMHYLYLVLCKNNSIYTGVTNDINVRSKRHRAGTGGWHTHLYPAIELLRVEKFETKQEALKRERQVKGWRREKKLNLIKFGKPVVK